jgi:hypothetical protein
VAQSYQTGEPVLADAVADVAHSAQRMVEEQIELLRLEVRKDMRGLLKASALGVSGVVALGVAVGMAAGAITWTLAIWMPFGPALGITAIITAIAGIVLGRMARSRLPGRASAEDSLAAGSSDRHKQLRPGHDVEASTT